LQFLTATDANRKKFLIDLLHLEKYVELFEVFKAASREVSNTSSTIAGKLATVEKWLETNKLTDTSILPMLDLEIDTSKYEEDLRYWMTEKENISEKNKKIRENNQYKTMLDKIDIGAISSSTVVWNSYDDLQEQLGSLQAVATGAQRTLDKLEKISDECPTCGQSIDVSAETAMIEVERVKRDEAHGKAMKIRPQIQEIKANNAIFEQNEKDQKTWEDLYRSYDKSLPTDILEESEIDASIEQCSKQLKDARTQLAENAAENERRTRLNTRIQVIQEQTAEFVEQQEEYDGKLAGNQKLEADLEILKKSFSTNGLLAYKIENLVGELEELANEYLAELSDGRFTLEFIVSNDKLNVQITDNGNVVDILALSSGELARVNTATLIAIRRLMSSISKSKINVLFLDEVISVLDDAGKERIVEVLLREDMNTYLVSHGWSHPLLEKIEVVKDGNTSVLE
jgi:DNA repair exonuclease SbcCD ATPase subunit